MDLFSELSASLRRHQADPCFCINERFFTYEEFGTVVSSIKAWGREHLAPEECLIGLVVNDDIQTYASIIALWSEGKAYVPIVPEAPAERNRGIIAQAGITTLLSSSESTLVPPGRVVRTDHLPVTDVDLAFVPHPDHELAYMLFTSGTTGQPKGVPITRANLAAFIRAFRALGIPVDRKDRCLQMIELTFDPSIVSFLVPLLAGACVYTVPKNEIKYGYVAGLIEERKLTLAWMVPSIINYLRPYFSEINCPDLKYCLFCGEGLPLDVTEEWSRCVPNASIRNLYGPTEHTIVCTEYRFDRSGNNKHHNGILSIGRPMSGSTMVVIDGSSRILPAGESGELCLSGDQLTSGYWNDPEKTGRAFFHAEHQGMRRRFYRTGDLCRIDQEGDILYMGRIDQQVKVQGHRVELGEIEHHARSFLKKINAVALAVPNEVGNTEIALVIESPDADTRGLIEHLRASVPTYMVPTRITHVDVFPLNASGKIDRKALQQVLLPVGP